MGQCKFWLANRWVVLRLTQPTWVEPTPKENPAAVALGRLGGKKDGPARAKKLSAQKRKEIAQIAAKTR